MNMKIKYPESKQSIWKGAIKIITEIFKLGVKSYLSKHKKFSNIKNKEDKK